MPKQMSILLLFLFALFPTTTQRGQDLFATEIVPQAVWTSAEATADHAASLMIDGSIATYAQLLDDSRTCQNDKTLPPKGSTPVTALVVFDLGKIQTTSRIRLTSQKSLLCRLPQNESFFACLGCHEDKRETKLNQTRKIAMSKPPQKLRPHANMPHPLLDRLSQGDRFTNLQNYLSVNQPREIDAPGPVEGFSYLNRVQPILDRHCTACHIGDVKNPDKKKSSPLNLTGTRVNLGGSSMRLVTQSFLSLTKEGEWISCPDELDAFVKQNGKLPLAVWYHPQGPATMIPPYAAGSGKSRLMDYLEPSHYDVKLTADEK